MLNSQTKFSLKKIQKSFETSSNAINEKKEIINNLPKFIRNLHAFTDITLYPIKVNIKASKIIQDLIPYCIDQGINTPRNLQLPFKKAIESAPPIEILNRSAFVSYIIEKFNFVEEARGKVFFRLIDLKDFRAADQVEGQNGVRGADHLINKVALNLSLNINKINKILKDNFINGEVIESRYGGDELAIAFLNIESKELRDYIFEELISYERGIRSVKGYYLRRDSKTGKKVPVEENVDIKKELGLEEIYIPLEENKAKIFWEQFRIGIISQAKEIEDIASFTNEITLAREYKKDIDRDNDTFSAFINDHPELGELSKEVSDLQALISENESYIKDSFADFIQNNIYDRLLGEKFTTINDILKELKSDNLERIFVYDIKGIKEINDNFSLKVGDLFIKALGLELLELTREEYKWKRPTLKELIAGIRWNKPESEKSRIRSSFINTRRGSFFAIGLRKGHNVSKRRIKELKDFNKISVKDGNNRFELEIASHVVVPKFDELTEMDAVELFKEMFNESERKWFQSQMENLLSNSDLRSRFLMELRENEKPQTLLELSNQELFLRLFFLGKRTEERLGVARNVLSLMIGDQEIIGKYQFENIQKLRDSIEKYLYRNQDKPSLTITKTTSNITHSDKTKNKLKAKSTSKMVIPHRPQNYRVFNPKGSEFY